MTTTAEPWTVVLERKDVYYRDGNTMTHLTLHAAKDGSYRINVTAESMPHSFVWSHMPAEQMRREASKFAAEHGFLLKSRVQHIGKGWAWRYEAVRA